MEDENDLYESGLEDEGMDTMPVGEADVIAESPLSIASAEPASYRERLRERLLSSIDTSEAEAEQYGATLAKIEEAKKNLLQAPDRRQYLQGLASKLTAPRTEADPRFFERRNLFTFLRDVGEYGQEQKAAEKERQAKLIQLQELQARYGLEEAQKRRGRAEQLIAQYLSREPTERDTRTQDAKNAADMGMTLKEYLEFKASLTKKTGDGLPSGEAAQFIWAERTLDDPNASAADKRAAKGLLEKKTPFDIRKSKMLEDKNSANYLARIKQQNEFTIPIIDEAIRQAEEGGVLATGNLSRWVEGKPWIGQAATDLERTLEAIKSNVGFEKLAELKELSPSGASGLGAVSNAEQVLLQSVRGSVSRDQSKENLVRNLQRIKDFYQKEIFQILERETGMRGITDIDEAINVLQNKASGDTSSPNVQSSGGEESPAEKARKELERRRAGGG
jgi:hypothetical protein